ncbi:MAG: hypothetical protein K2N91_03585, partial [Muribaculaceae bacterium]|nr:hypothetical protein [Muribaculaceae bacterium]
YNYDIPGYSGSFIIDGDSIIHFSHNGIKIRDIGSSPAYRNFIITTPEGLEYRFGHVEYCERYDKLEEGVDLIHDLSYDVPVVWNLTAIESLNSSDWVYISYTSYNYTDYDDVPKTLKYSRKWSCQDGLNSYLTSDESHSDAKSTYKSRAVPNEIKSKSFSIKFETQRKHNSTSDGVPLFIKKIILKDNGNNEIRKIVFDNNNTFNDRYDRTRLDGVSIYADDKLGDRQKFTYNEGYENSLWDFFGYANGVPRDGRLENILDHDSFGGNMDFKLNPNRRSNPEAAKAWSLETITAATGVVTTFTYSSNVWSSPAGSISSPLSVVRNGLVVSEIKTYDPITGRERYRSFIYDKPEMSLNLQSLTPSHFISLSGVKNYAPGWWKYEDMTTYTLTATLTASSCISGVPAENMAIYYGKVIEILSGTGIEHPIRTEYHYDNSYCISSGSGGGGVGGSTDFLSVQDFTMRLGGTIPYTSARIPVMGYVSVDYPDEEKFRQIFGARSEFLNFNERVGAQPLLSKKIVYEYRDNTYRPLETTENFYSCRNSISHPVSLYIQSNVYKTLDDRNSKARYDYNMLDRTMGSPTIQAQAWAV